MQGLYGVWDSLQEQVIQSAMSMFIASQEVDILNEKDELENGKRSRPRYFMCAVTGGMVAVQGEQERDDLHQEIQQNGTYPLV